MTFVLLAGHRKRKDKSRYERQCGDTVTDNQGTNCKSPSAFSTLLDLVEGDVTCTHNENCDDGHPREEQTHEGQHCHRCCHDGLAVDRLDGCFRLAGLNDLR